MNKIFVINKTRPILDIHMAKHDNFPMGLNRDRQPDAGWGELRRSNMSLDIVEEVELTEELLITLIEDLAYVYGKDTDNFSKKLKEFNLNITCNEH